MQPGDLANIIQHAPEMVTETRRQGRLSNTFMDTLGIHKLPEVEHRDRDASCLAQQGPVCLTHAATRDREDAYARRQEVAIQQKQLEIAQALVNSTRAAVDKAAIATATKRAEAARIAALSPEETKAEAVAKKIAKDAKKLVTAAAKVEKARIMADKLIAAEALIASQEF